MLVEVVEHLSKHLRVLRLELVALAVAELVGQIPVVLVALVRQILEAVVVVRKALLMLAAQAAAV
jgi:hypothetical protein